MIRKLITLSLLILMCFTLTQCNDNSVEGLLTDYQKLVENGKNIKGNDDFIAQIQKASKLRDRVKANKTLIDDYIKKNPNKMEKIKEMRDGLSAN